MKQITFFLAAIILAITTMAQAPQGINYQTVIRDGDGNILPDTELTLQMTIRTGAPDGAVVYSETHDATTNAFGLVNLVIGYGVPLSNAFADINWGDSEKYLETAIDLDGSGDFIVLGVTQFLSVPYSNFSGISGGILTMTTPERNALENPPTGMQIYNATTNCLNYFNGTSWFETCGECTPMPTLANAGPNQYFNDETVATNLEGNTPEFGTGIWSVVSGTGGIFEDANNPTTLFTGQACETYTLKWTIANPCCSTSDNVNIQFDTQPTTADAGENQLFLDNTTYTALEGNTPQMGEGLWSIQSGQGGSFDDPADPITSFTGQQCETYVLRWTISTPCHTSWDEVEIQFDATPTTANAGPNQLFNDNTIRAILAANTPMIGTGIWTILSGQGGSISNATNPFAKFTGQQCQTYILRWTISTPCHNSYDDVQVKFDATPTNANAGNDTIVLGGDLTVYLNANTPEQGNGFWSIVSGEGGTFEDVSNPQTLFTGLPYVDYSLKWAISTLCHNSHDEVDVAFYPWQCGMTITDDRDSQSYETVQIGDQCWMAENLNIGVRINGDLEQSNNEIYEKYCYDNAEINCDTYGGLYQWAEMMQYDTIAKQKGICPLGWHLPTDEEWCTMEQEVDPTVVCDITGWRGFNCGGKLKETGIIHWNNPNTGATNLSGFTALPGGMRYWNYLTFGYIGHSGHWWSSTQINDSQGWIRVLNHNYQHVNRTNAPLLNGFSVRCLKDN